MILVFSALLEFALVNVLTRGKKKLIKETERIVQATDPTVTQPLAEDTVVVSGIALPV